MTRLRLRSSFLTTSTLACTLAFSLGSLACADDGDEGDTDAAETSGDGDGDATTTGDGDGDGTTTGDGDGDGTTTGDGDGDATTTGDGDGDGELGCEGITPERIELTPDELAAMLEAKDFELINVHIPYAGEIPGTDTNLAFDDVPAIAAYLGDDLGTRAVLYCLTGPMSQIAGDALAELGYCQIYDMPAGMIGWEAEGYPIDE